MGKPTVYYLIGGLLAALLLASIIYYAVFLFVKISAVSEKTLPTVPEIANFNLEKFNELRLR